MPTAFRLLCTLLLVCCTLLSSGETLYAQQLLGQPTLNQYGLTRGWYAQAPVSSEQYRVIDVQYHTGELFVLTDSGFVVSYDAVTGRQRWSIRVGDPRQNYTSLGVGNRAVALGNGARIIAIGRKDYQVPLDSKQTDEINKTKPARGAKPVVEYRTVPMVGKIIFDVRSEHVAAVAPAVSDEAVFVPNLEGMIDRYDLSFEPEVRYMGALQADGVCQSAPVVSALGTAWLTNKGTLGLASPKGDRTLYTYRLRGRGAVSPGVRGTAVFVGTEFGEISMFGTQKGEPTWNTSIGVALRTAPTVIDKSLFVVSRDFRLFKIDTTTGYEAWQANNMRQFLALTPTRVYALDELQRLAFLNPETGAIQGAMPLPTETEMIIANAHSDQIFLVSSRGVIQELHETALLARIDYLAPPKAAKPEAGKNKPKPKPAVPAVDPNAPDPFAAPADGKPAAPADDPFAAPPAAKPATPAAADDPFAAPPAGEMPKPAAPAADDPFGK